MRPPCGHAGWGSDLMKKAAPEKLGEKSAYRAAWRALPAMAASK